MPTMYNVCQEAGVSTATVSRVINNSSKVSDKSRKTVLNAMNKLGYRPNQAARTLAGKKTDMLGVILPEIDNGFYAQVLRGINDATIHAGKHLLTAFYDNEKSLKKTLHNLAHQSRTDAVIVMNSSLSIRKLDKMIDPRTPLVLIGQRNDSSAKFDIIGINNENGAYEATSHLLDQAHEKLLLITGPHQNMDSARRLNGVKKAFIDADRDFEMVDQISGVFTFESGKAAMNEYMDATPDVPDAIFAFNDLMALGAIAAMKQRDIDIQRVEVIGFDGTELAQFAKLSTVLIPMREIGFEAGTLAIRRMKSRPTTPTTINLSTSLKLSKPQ